MTRYIVTFDLDSTLCDTRHRRHIIGPTEEETDWKAYAMACADDAPVESVLFLARTLAVLHDVWIISSRHSEARELTEAWLRKHHVDYKGVLLQGADGPQDLQAHKVDAMREIERLTHNYVVLHVDDSPSVAEAMKAAGVPTLLVSPPGRTAWVAV